MSLTVSFLLTQSDLSFVVPLLLVVVEAVDTVSVPPLPLEYTIMATNIIKLTTAKQVQLESTI